MPPVSESSSATGTGCQQLHNNATGRKHRKSVSFSSTTQIIHIGLADMSNFPVDDKRRANRHRSQASTSHIQSTSATTSPVPMTKGPRRHTISSVARSTGHSSLPVARLGDNSSYPASSSRKESGPRHYIDGAQFSPLEAQRPIPPAEGTRFVIEHADSLELTKGGSHSLSSSSPGPTPSLLEQEGACPDRPLPLYEPDFSPQTCLPSRVVQKEREISSPTQGFARLSSPASATRLVSLRSSSEAAQEVRIRRLDQQWPWPQGSDHHQLSERQGVPFIVPSMNRLPSSRVCATVNARVSQSFDLPMFDLAEYLKRRTYVVRKRSLDASPQSQHCITILDISVDPLFPSLASLPAVSLPDGPPQQLQLFDIQPADASPYFPSSSSSEVRPGSDAPFKPFGIFARLPIPVNAAIIVERPVFIVPHVMWTFSVFKETFERAIETLDDDTREIILNFSKTLIAQDAKTAHEGISKAKAFAIRLPVPSEAEVGQFGELETHMGIFLDASRINHSCSPNAQWDWDLKTLSLVVKSVRPIASGEEITISYVSPSLSYASRRDLLLRDYGFHCACASCVRIAGPLAFNPAAELRPEVEREWFHQIQESDAARKMLAHFWDAGERERLSFTRWCRDLTLPADLLISAHVKALGLIRREGLEILDAHPGHSPSNPSYSPKSSVVDVIVHPLRDVGRHIDIIAMCYGALEDVDNFIFWITEAAGARGFDLRAPAVPGKRNSLGPKDERTAFLKWIANPLSFPVWGWRTKGPRED